MKYRLKNKLGFLLILTAVLCISDGVCGENSNVIYYGISTDAHYRPSIYVWNGSNNNEWPGKLMDYYGYVNYNNHSYVVYKYQWNNPIGNYIVLRGLCGNNCKMTEDEVMTDDATNVCYLPTDNAWINPSLVTTEDPSYVYFDNTQSWSGVYVYFYPEAIDNAEYWSNDNQGAGSGTGSKYFNCGPFQMESVGGTIYRYPNHGFNTVVGFTETSQSNYNNFSGTKAAYSGSSKYNVTGRWSTSTPKFTPTSTTHSVNSTNYYNGSWGEYSACVDPDNTKTVGGGGNICPDESATITLSGSEIGYTYELYLGGSATGTTLPGNGSSLSFTGVTDAGTYTVYGYMSGCTPVQMEGSVSSVTVSSKGVTISSIDPDPSSETIHEYEPVTFEASGSATWSINIVPTGITGTDAYLSTTNDVSTVFKGAKGIIGSYTVRATANNCNTDTTFSVAEWDDDCE